MNPLELGVVFFAAILVVAGCQTAPTKSASAEPTVLTPSQQQGSLKGRWTSQVSSRWSGTLKISIDANEGSPDFKGQIQFGESSCTQWKSFTGTVSGDNNVTLESDLGFPCGKVVVTGEFQGGKLVGSYRAEYPDNGKIEAR